MDEALQRQLERREAVILEIRRILVEDVRVGLPLDAIDLDAPLFVTGLGLDSVDSVELVVSTEERFGIRFQEAALRHGLRSVNTLVDLVLESTSGRSSPLEGASG